MILHLITDEIFAVSVSQKEAVSKEYMYGLITLPYLGWTLGTLLGSLIGNVLPEIVMDAMCLAIYGMFLAIVIPPAKKSFAVLAVVLASTLFNCIFYYVPLLKNVSSGIAISVCAILAAVIGAIFFPVDNEKEDSQ